MSAVIAREHAEWLSLIDISGPFLSVEVLTKALPQGLDARDSTIAAELRAAYEEWSDEQDDRAIHGAWVDYVLGTALELPDRVTARGQAIPTTLQFSVPEYGETSRPDIIIHNLDKPAEPRMLVMTYPPGQNLEGEIKDARWKSSPAQRMQDLLSRTDMRLGLVTNGDQWMLANAKRNETTGFITWEADLWTQEPLCLRSFRSLFSAHRFFSVPKEETLETWLDDSANDQAEVTNQLGYQVRRAVEIIVQRIDRLDTDSDSELLKGVSEDALYEAALTVMMRLVFLMSAEERDLMPMDNPLYVQHYAVSPLRGQLREAADQVSEQVVERRHDAWSRLLATFRAVHGGIEHHDLMLPAYGGSLFDPDRFPFLEGRAPGTQWRESTEEPLKIDNRTVLHLLQALQLLQVPYGKRTETRRLSFRALDIEQIGHVYEGLLDHQATRAETVILGLKGTRDKEPEVALPDLQEQARKNIDGSNEDLVAFVREESGRSPSAIRKDIGAEFDNRRAGPLLEACNNDEDLYRRVKPFANLIRDDHVGDPVVIPAGSVYVTSGTTRRATGTHYTPESLTEPIVLHTLEPLVYRGPAEGRPRDKWKLKGPAELLDLKICDMAMGSGAFLVQVVRYLSERLVEAWNALSSAPRVVPEFTVEGAPPTGSLSDILIPVEPDERIVLARRLIADRCIYGVDKNPLAVEMAKLSLWLITLEKNRAFTFLDHALKCGDSLVGVDLNQLANWSLDKSGKPMEVPLLATRIRHQIDDVIKLRAQLESFTVKDIRDQQEKSRLHKEADARINDLRTAGNLLLASYFNDYKKDRQKAMRGALLDVVQRGEDLSAAYAEAVTAVTAERPFHWGLEFPEVFLNGRSGFDGFVGNPPFQSGKGGENSITAVFGE